MVAGGNEIYCSKLTMLMSMIFDLQLRENTKVILFHYCQEFGRPTHPLTH